MEYVIEHRWANKFIVRVYLHFRREFVSRAFEFIGKVNRLIQIITGDLWCNEDWVYNKACRYQTLDTFASSCSAGSPKLRHPGYAMFPNGSKL